MAARKEFHNNSQAIIDYIKKCIHSAKFKITRLKQVENPVKNKVIFAIFEFHDHELSLMLAKAILDKFGNDLVALEHPIERTGYLEQNNFAGDQKLNADFDPELSEENTGFMKSLQVFCSFAAKKNIPVVCIDDTQLLDLAHKPGKFPHELMPYFNQIMQEYDDEDKAADTVRNDIMAHVLNYFTTAKNIITINGAAHKKDLLNKLKILDPGVKLLSILIFVKPGQKEPEVRMDGEGNMQVLLPKAELTQEFMAKILIQIEAQLSKIKERKIEVSPASTPSSQFHSAATESAKKAGKKRKEPASEPPEEENPTAPRKKSKS